MEIRNRIKGLRMAKASELEAHPKNWRRHGNSQRAAMQTMLERLGHAQAVLAYEKDNGRLGLIDGHLRSDLAGDEEIPTLVLDLTEEEADVLLASLDPLAGMADADLDALGELLNDLDELPPIDYDALYEPSIDTEREWEEKQMPGYDNKDVATQLRRLTIHFFDEAAVADFVEKLGIELSEKARHLNYPPEKFTEGVHVASPTLPDDGGGLPETGEEAKE